MIRAAYSKPQNFEPPESGNGRTYGSCTSVVALGDGRVMGHVYKETVIDSNGRPFRSQWYAHKVGSRVHVLRLASTRMGAAELLGAKIDRASML